MPGPGSSGWDGKTPELVWAGTVAKLRCTMEESAVCTAGDTPSTLHPSLSGYSPISQSSSTIQLTGLGQWKTINLLLEVDGLMPGYWLVVIKGI